MFHASFAVDETWDHVVMERFRIWSRWTSITFCRSCPFRFHLHNFRACHLLMPKYFSSIYLTIEYISVCWSKGHGHTWRLISLQRTDLIYRIWWSCELWWVSSLFSQCGRLLHHLPFVRQLLYPPQHSCSSAVHTVTGICSLWHTYTIHNTQYTIHIMN